MTDPDRPDDTPRTPGEMMRTARDVAVRSVTDLFRDDGQYWSAALAYYGLLSTFPLILAGASAASFVVDPAWAARQATGVLGAFLPEGDRLVRGVIDDAVAARGAAGVISVLALLWTGSRVFGTLAAALNIAFGVEERYGFWRRRAVEVVMTLTVGVLFVLALASGVLGDLLWRLLEPVPDGGLLFRAARWLVPALLLLAVFFILYRFVPQRDVARSSALTGAAVATGLFLAARPVFFLYITRVAEFSLIYGSIGIVILLLLWTWVVALIALLGGEVAAHVQLIVVEGRPAHEVRRRHEARTPKS